MDKRYHPGHKDVPAFTEIVMIRVYVADETNKILQVYVIDVEFDSDNAAIAEAIDDFMQESFILQETR